MNRNVLLIAPLVLLGLCLMGGLLAGCMDKGRPIPAPPLPSLGDTVTTMGIGCTLVSVQVAPSNIQPGDDHEIIVVTIRLTNQTAGKNSFRYSSSDFSITAILKSGEAPAGTNLTSQSMYASQVPETLVAGTLNPGDTIIRKLIFKIPKESQKGTLYWRPQSLFRSKTGIWIFNL